MSLVLEAREAGIAILTLNRPNQLNAANFDLQVELGVRLRSLSEDASVRAMVLTGAGRAFCAGGDTKLFHAIRGSAALRQTVRRMHGAMMELLLGLRIPTIAAVNGPAAGFGAELVALCDMAVIAEEAYLCDPHVRFRVGAGPACQLIWPRLTSRAVVMELLLTGRRVGATEAVRLGLVNRVAPEESVLATALEMAREMVGLPREGVRATKIQLGNASAARGRLVESSEGKPARRSLNQVERRCRRPS